MRLTQPLPKTPPKDLEYRSKDVALEEAGFNIEDTLLFRFAADLGEQIDRHKWLESEKAGHDIGPVNARVDFTLKHYSGWRKAWRKANLVTDDGTGRNN